MLGLDPTLTTELGLTPAGSGPATSGLTNSGAVMKRKCNFITLEEKYKALKAIERKEVKITELCSRLDVGRSTVAGWLALKDKIYHDYESRQLNNNKRIKMAGSKIKQIEDLLIHYIEENRESNSNISLDFSHLISKANEFGKILGDYEFKCDIHWLNYFLKKNNIKIDDSRYPNGSQDNAGNHLFVDDGVNVNGLESNGDNSRASDRNGDIDADNFDVENGYEEADPGSLTPVPCNDEIRNYISKMRTFYLNKIDECNKFLRQLDDMENNL